MTHDEMIAVIQADKDGKAIEGRICSGLGDWYDNPNPVWNFQHCEYREKPEPREWKLINCNRFSSITLVDGKCGDRQCTNCERIKVREVIE